MTTAPRLTIDLSALAANWQHLNALSPDAQTAAVVKANGYGLGIEEVVPSLWDAGCRTFFVAMVEEGVRLRASLPQARVFVLNGIFRDTVETALEHDLYPVLSTHDQIAMWIAASRGRPCAIHVDTGMNRLGLGMAEAQKLAANKAMVSNSGAVLLMSHFACADDPGHELNVMQLSNFMEISDQFTGLEKSLANSAAILSAPSTHFDLTRPGIALYGGEAVNDVANPMKPVVWAQVRILQVRHVRKGESVGYGAAHVLERDRIIATCSGGYADGFHRSNSGAGVPLRATGVAGGLGFLDGHEVPVLGRVSMDLTAFDVTDVPLQVAKPGAWVELFGPNVAIDDVARAAGTIGYELLTGLGQRYQRKYI